MLKLSPSTLGDFNKCPACFWFDKKMGKPKPRGIFQSLTSGIARVLKPCYDAWRSNDQLPPELKGKVGGLLFADQAKMTIWRNARGGGLTCTVGEASLHGAVDDAIDENGALTILDAKTRGSAPKDGDSERYYGTQMDAYGLLFRENGHPITGKGHLAYYWPNLAHEYAGQAVAGMVVPIHFVFHTEVVNLEIKPGRTLELIARIVEALGRDTAPASAPYCEYCNFVSTRTGG